MYSIVFSPFSKLLALDQIFLKIHVGSVLNDPNRKIVVESRYPNAGSVKGVLHYA